MEEDQPVYNDSYMGGYGECLVGHCDLETGKFVFLKKPWYPGSGEPKPSMDDLKPSNE